MPITSQIYHCYGICSNYEAKKIIVIDSTLSYTHACDIYAGNSVIRLDWTRRLKIALDIARGLDYLHQHAHPAIIHRDIKSSNILLDECLNAKVADFGLSKMVDFGKDHVTTQVKGTMVGA